MKITRVMFAIVFAALLLSCAAPASTNAPVAVWYEASYTVAADGQRIQKVVSIPWAPGLTALGAITSAGGYSTPPYRCICLVREGRSTLLPDPRQIKRQEDDLLLQPGD